MVIRELTRRFGAAVAVDRVDLVVPQGTIFGLLGPNGAGKTTMIKMLITLLAPSDGTATIAGWDVHARPAQVRRLVGYVPQLLSADGSLTAERQVNTSERTTLFITTHDMEEADALCHQLAIMHRGRVVAQGTPGDLKAQIGPEATLDDVFIRYTGGTHGVEEGGFRAASRTRRTARRLG